MTVIRALSIAFFALLISVNIAQAQQSKPTVDLTTALDAICAGREEECLGLLSTSSGPSLSLNLEVCATNPCDPACPMHVTAKCVAPTDIPANLRDCFEDYSRCFLVSDEVLPWPWDLEGPTVRETILQRPRIRPWGKMIEEHLGTTR